MFRLSRLSGGNRKIQIRSNDRYGRKLNASRRRGLTGRKWGLKQGRIRIFGFIERNIFRDKDSARRRKTFVSFMGSRITQEKTLM